MYLNPTKQGDAYPALQSNPAPGLVYFPDGFIHIFYPSDKRAAGFVTIEHDGMQVTACAWDDEAYQRWVDANPGTDELEIAKTERIKQSKDDLAFYLESHPLQWTDGEYYSITQEKQNQLTSKIMAATMAQTLSADYTLTWNSTGEVCKEWTLSDLSALAFAIDKRVTALVTYQQTQEVAIRNAATLEELEAVVVDYNNVEVGT